MIKTLRSLLMPPWLVFLTNHFDYTMGNKLRPLFISCLAILSALITQAQQNSFTVASWNLKDFGRSKSDEEIEFIAKTIQNVDVLLIQEVVAKDPAGAQAVGRLGEALNRLGTKWDYRVSDISSGENSYKRERYAFLWKPSKLQLLGRPWLETKFNAEINREPFFATFVIASDTVTLVNFHAITKAKQPETEVKYFKFLPAEYPTLNLLFCGDFNLPQSHTVFNPLKGMGYAPVFMDQKTTLKKNCPGEKCLSEPFDNFYFNTRKMTALSSATIHFYREFESMEEAYLVSDHLPIVAEFGFE
ncbi:MAG: Endonuclease/exonuclease/phosphatase [Ferruginibacter sp.]|nr:Endonuclease/exonuclease/phosphatase [Ferruginibacter sp.]